MPIDPHRSSAIEACETNLAELVKRGDFAAVAAAFSDDAVMLPPGSEILIGRSSIQAYWARGKGAGAEVEFAPTDIKSIDGNAVREVGSLILRSRGQRQKVREVSCKYLLLWNLIDGEWKVETWVWNRIVDRSAAGARKGRRPGQRGNAGRGGRGIGKGGNRSGGNGGGGGRRGNAPKEQGEASEGSRRFQGGGGKGQGRRGSQGAGGGKQGGQGRFQGGGEKSGRGGGRGNSKGGRDGEGGRGGSNRAPEPFVPRLDD